MEAKLPQLNQIKTKKPLTRYKDFLENLSLKLLCDVTFPSLPGQSDIPCFTMTIFHLDDCHWQPNVSNHTNLKQKTSN